MSEEEFSKCQREFDRHIKEAKRAAFYSLTLGEKLICLSRTKILQEQKAAFIRKFMQSPDNKFQ